MELRLGAEATPGLTRARFTQQLSPELCFRWKIQHCQAVELGHGLRWQQVVPQVGIAFYGFKPPPSLAEIFFPKISWM